GRFRRHVRLSRIGEGRDVGRVRPVRWRDVDVAAATTACAHADPLPAPAVVLLEHRAGGGDGGAAGGDGNLRAGLVVHLLDVARQLGGVDLRNHVDRAGDGGFGGRTLECVEAFGVLVVQFRDDLVRQRLRARLRVVAATAAAVGLLVVREEEPRRDETSDAERAQHQDDDRHDGDDHPGVGLLRRLGRITAAGRISTRGRVITAGRKAAGVRIAATSWEAAGGRVLLLVVIAALLLVSLPSRVGILLITLVVGV